jgi:UDP-glucose 4-epimerase
MKRILVTGTNGFIGSALVKGLIKLEYDVWCLARNPLKLKSDSKYVNYINSDLTKLKDNLGSYYAVINCAASLENNSSWKKLSENNCSALENLILNVDCARFIHISSCSIFSEKSNTHSKPDPTNFYGLSKYVSEKILEFNSNKFDSSIIIRYPIVIGAKKSTNDFFNYIINNALKNNLIELYGRGTFLRNVIHISEAILGILSALEINSDVCYKKVNVGSSNSETVLDICKYILKETHSTSDIILSKNKGSTDFDAYVDVSKCSIIDYSCITIKENINKYLHEITDEI